MEYFIEVRTLRSSKVCKSNFGAWFNEEESKELFGLLQQTFEKYVSEHPTLAIKNSLEE